MAKLSLNLDKMSSEEALALEQKLEQQQDVIKKAENLKIQKQVKETKKQQVSDAYQFILTEFPALFDKANPKPLERKIEYRLFEHPKVIQKLEAEEFFKTTIREAVNIYARSKKYQYCVAKGKFRYGLEGQVIEEIATEHQEFALKRSRGERVFSQSLKLNLNKNKYYAL